MSRQFRAVAIVVALAAIAVVVISHRHHYRNSVVGGPIMVLVANRPIQKGTPGDVIRTTAGYYKLAGVSRSQVESNAIVNPSALSGKVALKDISAGQQLTAAEFAQPVIGPGIGSMQRAVVIKPSRKIGGQITPDSHVDILVARNGSTTLRELDRNMQVLAVSTDTGTVTLRALTPRQAGRLVYASANDRLVVRLHR